MSRDVLDLPLPSSPDTETAILGNIILDNRLIAEAIELLKPSDFYVPSHRRIFSAMVALFERGAEINPILIAEELRKANALEASGGLLLLNTLVHGLPVVRSLSHYARIVRGKSLLRQLIKAANQITATALEEEDEPNAILAQAESLIAEVLRGGGKLSSRPSRRSFAGVANEVDKVFSEWKEGRTRALVTGIPELDRKLKLGGFAKGELIYIGGATSRGKTALALQIAGFQASLNHKVLIFSLEMSAEALFMRTLSRVGRVENWKIRPDMFTFQETVDKLSAVFNTVKQLPLIVDDHTRDLERMIAVARDEVRFNNVEEIVVDYTQLVRADLDKGTREREVARISNALKELARILDVPVVATSTLSKKHLFEKRRPELEDMRECVVGETPVSLGDGTRVEIETLSGAAPTVCSMADGRATRAQASRVWRVGLRDCVTVRLYSGRAMTVAKRHRFYTGAGWLRAQELEDGARVALCRHAPPPTRAAQLRDFEIVMLAHMIGDGSYLTHQPIRYATVSEDNARAVEIAARSFNCDTYRRPGSVSGCFNVHITGNGTRWRKAGLTAWFEALGIFNQRSHEKTIPDDVFRLTTPKLARFIRHLWATDGSIAVGAEGLVSYSSTSECIAEPLMDLLQRFGIIARLTKGGDSYIVSIKGKEDQMRFLTRIGAFGARVTAAKYLETYLRTVETNTNVDTLPVEVWDVVRRRMKALGLSQRAMARMRGTSYGGTSHFKFAPSRRVLASYARLLDSQELWSWIRSDIFWDRVVSVEDAGRRSVYDMTVPATGNWLSSGVVQHNSGQLEYDADLVLFPWCEKIEDKDVRSMKLYCAKQRNGLVGWEEPIDFDATYQTFYTAQMYSDAARIDRAPLIEQPKASASPAQLAKTVIDDDDLRRLDEYDFEDRTDGL